MQFRTRAILMALVSAAAGFGIAIAVVIAWPGGGSNGKLTASETPAPTVSNGQSSQPSGQPLVASSCLAAADIYAQLRPSVVRISVSSGSGPFGQQAQGEGTGIVIDGRGHILTNNHVVENADSLEVKFADGTTAPAHLVGSDPGSDLAVIRVDGSTEDLKPAALGDSSAIRIGDSVFAIGNPFQLEGTFTAGIVSATDRTFNPGNGARPIPNLIQTDAPVNPGNSGGPLLNCLGKVIGVVSALENPTGQDVNVGVAFAVPSNSATRSLPDMIAGRTVRHPRLGIAGEDLTSALAEQLNLSVPSGVYVTVVASGSPAEQAGLHGAFSSESEAAGNSSLPSGGDVIIDVDGRAVSSVQQLAAYLDTKNVGDTVTLTIVRDGSEQSVQATLAEWPQ